MRVAPALFAAASLSLVACSPAPSRPPVASPQFGSTPMVASPPVRANAVQSLQGTVACAPKEVAPGEYAAFDCTPHRDVARALMPTMRMSFVSGPLPPFVDHRVTGLEGPVKSQGAVGTCTAMSLSSAMDHAVRKMGRGDVVSALHVWSKYAVSSMGVAGDQTEGERIALENSWPYDPVKACKLLREPFDSCGKAYGVTSGTGDLDSGLRAERKTADGSGKYRISAIEQLRSRPADVDEMAAVLAGGDAVWAAFSVNDDAWLGRNLQPGAVIPDYESDGGSGHAVVLAGYRTINGHRQFLVHNSWSPRWGEGGYGWLSDTMVQRHLRAAYKVRIAEGGGNNPGPGPAPNGCPQGQAPDSVTGSCAPVCASGSPPAAGVCLPSIPGLTPGGLPAIPGMPSPGAFPMPLPFPIPALPGMQPSPGPAPQGASCPQGQVPDVVTQKCASTCPGGAPPMGGLCMPALPR